MRQAPMRRLREETREEHERLESRVDIVSHLGSQRAYAELVASFYGAYRALEPFLLARVPEDFGVSFEDREKLPSLQRDLAALGLPFESKALTVPELRSDGAIVGALYVVEGSTLGGQIISRMLREHRQIGPESGGAFFAGYGEDNGPRWREFVTATDEWLEKHNATDEAVDGAKLTFRWFDSVLASGM